MYATKTILAHADNGTPFQIIVPTDLPDDTTAAYLKGLWDTYIHEMDGHWKGRVQASVPSALANDVASAMEFMGAIVDKRVNDGCWGTDKTGRYCGSLTYLYSNGYWAHGF